MSKLLKSDKIARHNLRYLTEKSLLKPDKFTAKDKARIEQLTDQLQLWYDINANKFHPLDSID
jgi:hypothetical protein